jgi:hypothetical protein
MTPAHRTIDGVAGRRATHKRTQGVRHLFSALDLMTDKMYGPVKTKTKTNRTDFLAFCRYLRSLYPQRPGW